MATSCCITWHVTKLQWSPTGFSAWQWVWCSQTAWPDISPRGNRTHGLMDVQIVPSCQNWPSRLKVVQNPTQCWHGAPDKVPDEILLTGSNLIIQRIYPSIPLKTFFTAVPTPCLPATALIIQLFVALMSSAKWFLSAPSEALSRISSDGSI